MIFKLNGFVLDVYYSSVIKSYCAYLCYESLGFKYLCSYSSDDYPTSLSSFALYILCDISNYIYDYIDYVGKYFPDFIFPNIDFDDILQVSVDYRIDLNNDIMLDWYLSR